MSSTQLGLRGFVILALTATIVAVGCTAQTTARPARTSTHGGLSAEVADLWEQLESARRKLIVDAKTMERQQREIKALTEWIERFTSDPRETLKKLHAENKAMRKRLKEVEFWLGKYRQKYGEGSGRYGTSGIVKSVKGNLVVISVGSDDGVRNGDTYQLRRGSTHVGQVTITKVYKDQAIGTFDTEFKGPGAPPQPGDPADPRGYGG